MIVINIIIKLYIYFFEKKLFKIRCNLEITLNNLFIKKIVEQLKKKK